MCGLFQQVVPRFGRVELVDFQEGGTRYASVGGLSAGA